MDNGNDHRFCSISRLGRTALLVHCLALLYGLGGWCVWTATTIETRVSGGLGGMGAIAAAVFGLWAISLAFRALLAGECLRLPILVGASSLLFLSGITASFWYPIAQLKEPDSALDAAAVAYGLPLFVPFGSAVIPVGALLGVALARRAERRNCSHRSRPWDKRKTMKYVTFWSLAVSTLLTECCLPFPLYLYSVITQPLIPRGYQSVEHPDWRNRVIAETPGFVKKAVHYALSQCVSATTQRWRTRIVDQGELPSSILWSYIGSAVQTERQRAWSTLWETSPSALLGLALRIVQGDEKAPAYTQAEAGHLVGIRGAERDLRSILRAARTAKLPGLDQLVSSIVFRRDREALADDLFGLALAEGGLDRWVLYALGQFGDNDRLRELWVGYCDANDINRTRTLARTLHFIEDEDLYEELAGIYVRHPDLTVRREAVWADRTRHPLEPKSSLTTRRRVLRLLALLDDEDPVVSRGAAWSLGGMPYVLGCTFCLDGPATMEASWGAWSERDLQVRECIRAAANEWLAKQEKRVTSDE